MTDRYVGRHIDAFDSVNRAESNKIYGDGMKM